MSLILSHLAYWESAENGRLASICTRANASCLQHDGYPQGTVTWQMYQSWESDSKIIQNVQIHTESANNSYFLNVIAGGTHGKRWVLRGCLDTRNKLLNSSMTHLKTQTFHSEDTFTPKRHECKTTHNWKLITHSYISRVKPTGCTIYQIYFILEQHSSCFRRSFRPSSGV
jgi:hypothetical protein